MTDTSDLWNTLSTTLFEKIDPEFIANFRKPGGANNRLGAWDAYDSTMRYFKTILYSAATRQPDRFFSLYRKLELVDIGAPISVTVRSCEINIDYFLSLQEQMFLESAFDLGGIGSVLEIGAGFGRTCHALLALNDNIEKYTIVDLPNVLELSRQVLSRVLPGAFHKIEFVDAMDAAAWQGRKADLAINVDSFQEMPPTTIDAYMQDIIAHCGYLYVKNPIAKYAPETLGIVVPDRRILHDVFSLGYCRDVIDIFDDAKLGTCRKIYLDAYRPGSDWQVVDHKPSDPFPYYHHVLYKADRSAHA